MSLVRISLTDNTRYLWMNWNLFLALIPLLFAWLFEISSRIWVRVVLFLAWLFFLPNAIYMVTDFIHMNTSTDIELLWYDGMMLFAYALVGVYVSWMTTVKIVEEIPTGTYGRYGIYGAISLLTAFGIYLGRYIRWNTWDIVTRPLDLFVNVFDVITTHIHEPVFYLTIIFFTLFSLVSVFSYKQLLK